jgi:DNA (cytosine-5)-methyltransferase 1
MSSTYSAASADLALDSNALAGFGLSPFVSASLTAELCLQGIGRLFPAMTTFAHSQPIDSRQMELLSTSSAEASPARTLASQERGRGCQVNVPDYGESTPASFASFDPDTSSWRTSQHCLVEGLQRYLETWPRSGLMRNGTAYQLPPLVRLTVETESGLLPTPEASNTKAIALRSAGRSPRNFLLPTPTAKNYGSNQSASSGAAIRPSLTQMARKNLWPTPRANDAEKRGNFDAENPRNGLPAAVRLWPTPTSSLGTKGGRVTARKSREGGTLIEAVSARTATTGQLNPTWVEWLMGFPGEWTALDASVTPSSRKSQKSSGGQS